MRPLLFCGVMVFCVLLGLELFPPDFLISLKENETHSTSPSLDPTLPTATTDAQGHYQFLMLEPASHHVWLDLATLPAHLRQEVEGQSARLLLNPGDHQVSDLGPSDIRFDATYSQDGTTLEGYVFQDSNRNSLFDPHETGLSGVTVIDPGLFIYYVLGPNINLLNAFEVIDKCATDPTNPENDPDFGLDSTVSITANQNDALWYYDHWEDGYDVDPTVPGPSTQSGVLNSGQSQVFETRNDLSVIPTAPTVNIPPSAFSYDGRDRITIIGQPVNLTRIAWPSDVNTVLAGAWESYEVNHWGRDFSIPAGEDLQQRGFGDDFESSHLFVMAQENDTQVTYDLDGDAGPIPPVTENLQQGQNLHLYNPTPRNTVGGIVTGATVRASKRVQVHMLAGDCAGQPGQRRYTARGFHITPAARLENSYLITTPYFSDGNCGIPSGNDHESRAYIYNPHAAPITIRWQTRKTNGAFTIPPGTNEIYANLDPTSGVKLFTDDPADVFSVIVAVDTNSRDYDWGYTPVALSERTSEVILGWSPGTADINPRDGIPDSPTGGGSQNGNLAFVVPVQDTTVYVDLDGDGQPDNFDMDGDGQAISTAAFGNPAWDETQSNNGVPVAALEVLRVADPTPNNWNMNGTVIYTQNYAEQLAVVWGEDPCNSGIASPHFDGGFTIPPLPILILTKDDAISNYATICPIDPGGVVTYTVVAENSGRSDLIDLRIRDTFSYTSTFFVVGSLIAEPPPAAIEYNDGTYNPPGPPGTADPAVESWQVRWGQVQAQQSVTVTFTVQVDPNLAPTITTFFNSATAQSLNFPNIVVSRDTENPAAFDTSTCVNTPTPTPTPTLSATPTSQATATPTPIETATPTETPTHTATPAQPPTDTPTPAQTPTSTATPSSSLTGTPTATPDQTPPSTISPTATSTPRPTFTATPEATPGGTTSPTATPGQAPTIPAPSTFTPTPDSSKPPDSDKPTPQTGETIPPGAVQTPQPPTPTPTPPYPSLLPETGYLEPETPRPGAVKIPASLLGLISLLLAIISYGISTLRRK